MNLLEFIPYLNDLSRMESVILEEKPDLDIELADIYLEEELSVYSKMQFFNAEEIEGKLEMEYEGKKYINLFPLHLLLEIFEDLSNPERTDSKIAEEIMNYRIKDA